ncbi:MAG TPA: Six-hairpin glycosidase-like protein [Rheinheimera sp.]|nr:Six-hairpin glycosidase-like protein [Rheinheimera sp.]
MKFSTTPFSFSLLAIAIAAACPVQATKTLTQQQQFISANGTIDAEAKTTSTDDGQVQLRVYRFKAADGSIKSLELTPDMPQLQTKSVWFDGLYALAQQERRDNSVNEITDWGFNDQQAVPCPCFETGAKWHYVWTRDLSYSVDLGLGALDPQRAQRSLQFKTSKVRPELIAQGVSDTEVALQDTGSGGSWPISSDRIVWSLAASGLQAQDAAGNSDDAKQVWLNQWYSITRNTIMQDRQYIFDPVMGLYKGETSFLDWREQTYPRWTANDTVFLGESYALSTNVLHYVALQRAASAAKTQEPDKAQQFADWAQALKQAINDHFWLPEQGLYASVVGERQNPVPMQQYDLLGLALAITHQVATPPQAAQILQNYPLSNFSAPVVFPQQQQIPIYHNRASWPFVTAYTMRAAKQQDQADVYTKLAESLYLAAGIHTSNMENMEWLTGAVHVEDGALSGPVINSERQLWSVAAYLDFVIQQLFGIQQRGDHLLIDPYVPVKLARNVNLGATAELTNLTYNGLQLNVRLDIPNSGNPRQVYRLSQATLNEKPITLSKTHQLDIALADVETDRLDLVLQLTPVDSAPPITSKPFKLNKASGFTAAEQRQIFAPKEPELTLNITDKGYAELTFNNQGETDVQFQLYRNGKPINTKRASSYLDKSSKGPYSQCYSLTQTYKDTKLTSLPSRTLCTPGDSERFIAGEGLTANDQEVTHYLDLPVYKNWGLPEQQLTLQMTAKADGNQALRLQYFIDNGPINTGITAVVKQVLANCPQSGMQRAAIVMPHLATATEAGWSSNAYFNAKAGETCSISIVDGFNMSYLQHFTLYTGGKGGKTGPLNQAVIYAAEVRPVASTD